MDHDQVGNGKFVGWAYSPTVFLGTRKTVGEYAHPTILWREAVWGQRCAINDDVVGNRKFKNMRDLICDLQERVMLQRITKSPLHPRFQADFDVAQHEYCTICCILLHEIRCGVGGR